MSAPPLPGLATPARRAAVLATLAAAALLALGASLAVGSIDVSASAIVRALAGDTSDTASAIVRELRLPRALAAFAVGALLALAGALMQVLLRNPLADPYILGISGGAAAGALGAMLAGRRP
jgi:iron complex transport system permease protein